MIKLIALMLVSMSVNAQVYSDCPSGNCTVYQGGAAIPAPQRVTTPSTTTQQSCSSTETLIRVSKPIYVTLDNEGFKLSIPHISYNNVIYYTNEILLDLSGAWHIIKLNGITQ